MEVKINREIRNYTESMFFGLSLRQLIFSALVLEPRELRFEASTLYYDLLKSSMDKWEKEEYKRHD